jgi:hypothetical protein
MDSEDMNALFAALKNEIYQEAEKWLYIYIYIYMCVERFFNSEKIPPEFKL